LFQFHGRHLVGSILTSTPRRTPAAVADTGTTTSPGICLVFLAYTSRIRTASSSIRYMILQLCTASRTRNAPQRGPRPAVVQPEAFPAARPLGGAAEDPPLPSGPPW